MRGLGAFPMTAFALVALAASVFVPAGISWG